MAVIQEPFGATREGQAVDRFILRSGAAEAEIITFGAALRTLLVPTGPENRWTWCWAMTT